MLMANPTKTVIRFRIASTPGKPPTFYVVEPGDSCEVPDGYVKNGLIARLAPGLVAAKDKPAPSEPKESAPDKPKPKPAKRRTGKKE